MQKRIRGIPRVNVSIEVPGDKSISHRGLILGALSQGQVLVSNVSPGDGCAATVDCLRSMGISVEEHGLSGLMVSGKGTRGFTQPAAILNARNSATTMRLLCGVLAGQPFRSVITGDASLRSRPMQRVIKPLRAMGAQVYGSDGDTKAPLTIVGGKLRPIEYTMGVASAQVKSAILIAGLFCDGETVLKEITPTRDHTERMLRYLGADLTTSGGVVTVKGGAMLLPKDVRVPGDISSAMYFILAGVLMKESRVRITSVGLNPTRTGCLEVLRQMGADITFSVRGANNGEPWGEITARSSDLRSIEIGPEMITGVIDEIPALALAATQANGVTLIRGAGELRFKESDRLSSVTSELRKLGAMVREQDDGLEIEGPTRLVGATCDSHYDHRIAMTLAVAGLISKGETAIKNAAAVDASFPGFWGCLSLLAGGAND